jgi:hypothetical protein
MKIKIGIRNCSNETMSINKEPEALRHLLRQKMKLKLKQMKQKTIF